MRLLRLLALILAAPALSGCTLTLGLTGATIDHVSAQRPAVVYTLDTPPPLDTPVEVVTRDGRTQTGRWLGVENDGVENGLVVLAGKNGRQAAVRRDDVVQIRRRPGRTYFYAPMFLGGMVIDGLLAWRVIRSLPCVRGCTLVY